MSRWGLVAVCGAGLALAALLLVRGRNGSEVTQAGASTAAGDEPDSPTDELHEPALAPLALPRESLVAAWRESPLDVLPRAPLFGRLVEAGSRVALAVERIVLLASPDNSVAETLRSRLDGSFTSTRSFPRGSVRAWVKDPASGELLVRHEAEFDPERAGEWLVPVPSAAPARPARGEEPAKERAEEGTSVRGRVIDLAALPVANALVKVIPLGAPGEVRHGDTDPSGGFALPLVPGAHRLIVQGRFATSAAFEFVAVEGANDAGTILLPAAASAGDLRGRLVADRDEDEPFAFLVLRELARGRELVVTSEWERFWGEKDGISAFAIEGVPPGDYELEVVGVDGREYEPEVLRVSPPAEGLEFRARGPAPVEVVLVVRDELSGQPVESFSSLGRIHGHWVGDLDAELSRAFDRWAIQADGYRPAQGDFTDGRMVADEEGREHIELEVALRRGLGGAVLFKDLESDRLVAPELDGFLTAGLADVQVRADGEVVARSDPSGLAVFSLLRAPERLEFVRPGWRVASDRVDEGVRVVFLVRE